LRRNLSLVIMFTVLVLGILVYPAAAMDKGGRCPLSNKAAAPGDSMSEMFFRKISLIKENMDMLEVSEKQFEDIKTINTDAKKDIIRLDSDIAILAIDIKTELGNKKIDLNKVNGLIDKKYAAKANKAKKIVAAVVALKNTLNDEQTKALKAICQAEASKTKCPKSMMMSPMNNGQMMRNR